MPRAGRQKHLALTATIEKAERDFWSAWQNARNFQHSGIRGNEREEAVRRFLASRLPGAYKVGQGEVVDYLDKPSSQLDVLVYDGIRNCPIIAETDNLLLPAEALLAVIEVKSVLTAQELLTCYTAAKKLRGLNPFKSTFTSARHGSPANDGMYRCFYTVFAYNTNLTGDEWLKKEWQRIEEAAASADCDVDVIDRLIVLDRGMIVPVSRTAKQTVANGSDILHGWFTHLLNFLADENQRRTPVDWEIYAGGTQSGWERL